MDSWCINKNRNELKLSLPDGHDHIHENTPARDGCQTGDLAPMFIEVLYTVAVQNPHRHPSKAAYIVHYTYLYT